MGAISSQNILVQFIHLLMMNAVRTTEVLLQKKINKSLNMIYDDAYQFHHVLSSRRRVIMIDDYDNYDNLFVGV